MAALYTSWEILNRAIFELELADDFVGASHDSDRIIIDFEVTRCLP